MTKDFLIITPNAVTLKILLKVIDTLMENKKIKLSYHNYVVIGTKNKLMLDIKRNYIRGRIWDIDSDKEVEIIKNLINSICTDKIYIHYYSGTNFINDDKIITV